MKILQKHPYLNNKLMVSALIPAVLTLSSGCSVNYVNSIRIPFLSQNQAVQEELSVQQRPMAQGNTENTDHHPAAVSATVPGMGMTRTVNDVLVSAGSGDITQISADELEKIGMKLKEAELPETDSENKAAVSELNGRQQDAGLFRASKYAYGRLNEHEKKVYVEICHAIQGMKPEVPVSSLDVDEIDKCFNCVMIDNPEFFYTDGYKMTRTLLDGKLQNITFSPRFTMTGKEILEKEDGIDSYVNRFISEMPDLPDEYSKAKYIFDYLVENTEYDTDTENNQNICSVFIDNKSVCQGYAMAAKYLADELGIFCTVVYGSAGGENHAWNLMRLDGTYCHVDITWGDTSYRSSSDGTAGAMTDYVFFGASDDLISENHYVDSIVELPVCDSLDSYYFVREDRYFTERDPDRLRRAFDRAYADKEEILTIRCSDGDVYDDMDEYLFEDGRVFRYLKGNGKARYVRNRDELTISFLLT